MQVEVRQNPAFAVARLGLAPNEPVKVQSGAMMAMSPGVVLESKAEGGIMKSLIRSAAGGESFFVSSFHAPPEGGFVDVAATLAGDVVSIGIDERMPLFLSRGAWLANEHGIEIDTKFGGFKNVFGGEGGFVVQAAGRGQVVMACYGALERWDLGVGQHLVVDTGHMVGYDGSVQFQLRKASGGVVNSFKSGEGLVFEFAGPGRVWTQTRNPVELENWIQRLIPSRAS